MIWPKSLKIIQANVTFKEYTVVIFDCAANSIQFKETKDKEDNKILWNVTHRFDTYIRTYILT